MLRHRLTLLAALLLGPLWAGSVPARAAASGDRLVRAAEALSDESARAEMRSDGRIVARITSPVPPPDRSPGDGRLRTALPAGAPSTAPLASSPAGDTPSTYGLARTPRAEACCYDATAPPALPVSTRRA